MKAVMALLTLASLSSAFAREVAPPTLSGKELEALVSGATMRGEFVANGSRWAERTTKSGRVLDMLQGGKHVGAWYVAGDQICYIYFGKPPSTPCYLTAWDDSGRVLYFGDPKTGRTIARATTIERSRR